MSVRTRQPQGIVALNPAIPRPSFLFCPSVGLMDWTRTSRVGTRASGDSLRGTQQGVAYKVADATNGGLDFGVQALITSDIWTLLVFANPASTDGVGTLFSQRTGTSPYYQTNLLANSGTASVLASSPGNLAVAIYNNVGYTGYTTSGTVIDGAWHTFIAVRGRNGETSNIDLYRDGIALSTTISGSVITGVGGSQKVRVGNLGDYATDATYCLASDVALAVAWNGALPPALLQDLTPANVWGTIFAPSRRIWVQLGAATTGGTGTTATLAGTQDTDVGAITAEATTGAAIAGTQSSDVGAVTAETPANADVAGTQAADVGAITVEATTGAAIAGTQASDGAAIEVTAGTGQTDAAVAGIQASDVGAIAVSATLGLSLSGAQASDGGYIVVEATLPASMAGTRSSDVAAIVVAGTSIWTDVGVSATTWGDVGGASSIWTDL